MANLLRGEVGICLGGRAYTLRPTFHILCEIEERIGLTTPELLVRLKTKGLLASEILMIAVLATCHDGSEKLDSETVLERPAAEVNLHLLLPAIADFLLGAVGGQMGGKQEVPSAEATMMKPGELEWDSMLEAAYSVLKLAPDAFWKLTMPEFCCLLRAARQKQRAWVKPVPSEDDMRRMMAQFPDRCFAV